MLPVGADALTFELPAVVDGEIRRLSLEEFLGERIVVLAFYPGDFNPACGEESDLNDLDLFTMQPDVAVVAVGPDTVYSHRTFASKYDLDIALCADTRGAVAGAYEVAFEDEYGQSIPERAVFVVDLDGVVQYAWSTSNVNQLPDSEAIQRVVGDIGGDAAAVSRYRVGHAHYVEGRRAFTSAMAGFEGHEWMVARSDFERAREEFTTAAEHFATAGRFVGHAELADHFERARLKANALWQAADWLAAAADAFSSGDGEEGNAYREDAQSPLETARDLAEPLDPDAVTVEDEDVSIATEATDDAETTAAMAAIRDRDEEAAAGGVDLELGEVTIETADDDALPEQDGPDTDAARRMREYAGVGMDIDDPDGADDDRIADALDAADGESDGSDIVDEQSDATVDETGDERDGGVSPDPSGSSEGDDTDREDAESTKHEPGAETDVTEEEIEEIAEQLQSQSDDERDDDDGSEGITDPE